MHPDGVGSARRRGRGAGNDDHQVVGVTHPALDERGVDLAHHLIGGLHRPHQVRLGAPEQRQLALHVLVRREDQDALARLQPRQPARGVTRLGERDERDRAERVADVHRRFGDRAAGGARHVP